MNVGSCYECGQQLGMVYGTILYGRVKRKLHNRLKPGEKSTCVDQFYQRQRRLEDLERQQTAGLRQLQFA